MVKKVAFQISGSKRPRQFIFILKSALTQQGPNRESSGPSLVELIRKHPGCSCSITESTTKLHYKKVLYLVIKKVGFSRKIGKFRRCNLVNWLHSTRSDIVKISSIIKMLLRRRQISPFSSHPESCDII